MVDRYRQRTMPQAADVARPAQSSLTTIGQAAPQLAAPWMKVIDERQRGLEQAALNRARLDLSKEGTELELNLQKLDATGKPRGAAGDGYVPDVQAGREAIKSKVWSNLPKSVRESPRAQQAFDDLWTGDHEAASRRATVWQTGQQADYAVNSINDGLAETTAAIEKDPELSAAKLEEFRKSLPGYASLLTPDVIAKAEETGFQQIMLATVRGMTAQGRFDDADKLIADVGARLGVVERQAFQSEIDRTQAKAQGETAADLERQNIDGKLKIKDIDAEVAAKHITRDQGNSLVLQRQAIVERARAQVEAARADQQRQVIAASKGLKDAMEYDLLNGQATEADVHLAVNNGELLLDDANSLIRTAREGKGNRDLLAEILAAQAVGAPLDPYDSDTRKGMDLLWEGNGGAQAFTQEVQPQRADGSPAPYKINMGTSMVLDAAKKVGVIPPAAASSLQGMALNGTDEQKQTAFDTVAQLYDTNAGAVSAAFPDTADRVLKDALSWRQKTKAGISPLDALRAVERENTIPSDAVLKQRKTDADKAAAQISPDMVWKTLDAADWAPWLGDAAPLAPGADVEATEMMREAYRTEFVRTGDAGVALELAKAAVKRTIGRTKVGGAESTMAYPPEMFYAPGLQDYQPDWLNQDIIAGVSDLVKAGDIPGVDRNTLVNADQIRILSDSQTAREAREQQPPSYLVQWNGQLLDQRWRFDPGRAITQARVEGELAANEAKREGERVRALRQNGWDPNNSAADRQQPLKAKTLQELAAAEATAPKMGKRKPAYELWQAFEGIDQRYRQKGDDIRAKYGSNPASKAVGEERITAGNR